MHASEAPGRHRMNEIKSFTTMVNLTPKDLASETPHSEEQFARLTTALNRLDIEYSGQGDEGYFIAQGTINARSGHNYPLTITYRNQLWRAKIEGATSRPVIYSKTKTHLDAVAYLLTNYFEVDVGSASSTVGY